MKKWFIFIFKQPRPPRKNGVFFGINLRFDEEGEPEARLFDNGEDDIQVSGSPEFFTTVCLYARPFEAEFFAFDTLALNPIVMSFVSILLRQLVLIMSFLLFFHFVWFYLQSLLKVISNPFLTKFINIWRLTNQLTERSHRIQMRFHERHEPAILLGSNFVSLNDSDLIKVVYDVRNNFVKIRQSTFLSSSLVGSEYHLIKPLIKMK